MDEIHWIISREYLESIAGSLELHVSELEEVIPKMEGLLSLVANQRMIDVTDEEIKLGLKESKEILVEKQTLLSTIEGLLSPKALPPANFHG